MALEIACEKCGEHFLVTGYTTPDSRTEPGEVITDLELLDETDELCGCLLEGESFWVVNEDHETFPDDVM